MKKSKKAAIVTAVVLACAVGGGIVYATARPGAPSQQQIQAENVLSEEATKGSITQTVKGTGSLASETPVNVLVPTGLEVEEVYVKEGDQVEVGTQLAKVSSLSVSEQLLTIEEAIDTKDQQIKDLSSSEKHYDLKKQVLQAEKDDLIETRDMMEDLQDTCILTADSAGTIGKLYLEKEKKTGDAVSSAAGQSSTDGTTTQTTDTDTLSMDSLTDQSRSESYSGGGLMAMAYTMVKSDRRYVASAAGTMEESTEIEPADIDEYGSDENSLSGSSHSASDHDDLPDRNGTGNNGSSNAAPTKIAGTISVTLPAPQAGPVQTKTLYENDQYSVNIEWRNSENEVVSQLEAGNKYVAVITVTAKDSYCFPADITLDIDLTEGSSVSNIQLKPSNVSTDAEGNWTAVEFQAVCSVAAETGTDISGQTDAYDTSGLTSDFSTDAAGTAATTTQNVTYNKNLTTAATVVPSDTVLLDVDIDELDIDSLSVGQEATVTIDALDNKNVQGKITSIADTGKGSNGSAKFTVEIQLNKEDGMRYGMSASAQIVVKQSKDAILIPVAAIQSGDNGDCVYTSVDENGNLSDPVDVKTGISDGDKVEITSGLKEGQTVYYYPAASSSGDTGDEMTGEF